MRMTPNITITEWNLKFLAHWEGLLVEKSTHSHFPRKINERKWIQVLFFFFLDSSSRRYLVNKQTICHRLLRVTFTLRQRIVYMRALEFLTDMDYGGTSLNLEAEDPVYKYKPTSYFCKCLFSAFLFSFVFWRCSVHWSKNYWGPHWG